MEAFSKFGCQVLPAGLVAKEREPIYHTSSKDSVSINEFIMWELISSTYRKPHAGRFIRNLRLALWKGLSFWTGTHPGSEPGLVTSWLEIGETRKPYFTHYELMFGYLPSNSPCNLWQTADLLPRDDTADVTSSWHEAKGNVWRASYLVRRKYNERRVPRPRLGDVWGTSC